MPTDKPPICSYEGSDYQAAFWEHGGREYEDAVEGVALRRLLPPSGSLMLELGAGAGRNTLRYSQFGRVVLVDYSHTQLEQARQRLGASRRYVYVAADIYSLPFTAGLFDAATMIRTLHHMAEPQKALEQVRGVLAGGAAFILEFASKRNLKAMLRHALGRQSWSPYDRQPVEFAALNFDFHPSSVEEWLSASGFRVRRRLTVSHFRHPLFKKLLPLGWLVWMDSAAQLTGDWWQVTPSVFVLADAVGGEARPAGAFFKCLACGAGIPEPPADAAAVCPQCGRVWPCEGGIYDFRVA